MRIRIAPAPTGLLHVGAARVALIAWLLARHHGGHVLLRLDDADPGRGRPGWDEAADHDLAWLGVDFDATVRQSDRLDRYARPRRRHTPARAGPTRSGRPSTTTGSAGASRRSTTARCWR